MIVANDFLVQDPWQNIKGFTLEKNHFNVQNSWMRDPRYKHEYLDRFPKGPPKMMKVTNI